MNSPFNSKHSSHYIFNSFTQFDWKRYYKAIQGSSNCKLFGDRHHVAVFHSSQVHLAFLSITGQLYSQANLKLTPFITILIKNISFSVFLTILPKINFLHLTSRSSNIYLFQTKLNPISFSLVPVYLWCFPPDWAHVPRPRLMWSQLVSLPTDLSAVGQVLIYHINLLKTYICYLHTFKRDLHWAGALYILVPI